MSNRARDTVLIVLFSLFVPTIIVAGETIELFNGKDFTGWTKRGGAATYTIENGEIVGRSAPNTTNTFLCTDKDYGDFELELDFKIDPNDFNSGVQLRSHYRQENKQERVYGYQSEIDTEPRRPWTAGIYYEGGMLDEEATKAKKEPVWIRPGGWLNDLSKNEAAQKARKLGEWNHLKVVAKGRRIQTWLNGVPAADFTDKDDKAFSPSGLIALQVHSVGKNTDTKEVRWKNITIKEL
jgi:Domain of Unknown Function (DUF1080)